MNKKILIVIAFLSFISGASALVLSLVGVKLSYLLWLDAGGPLLGFVLRLVLIFGGVILAYLSMRDKVAEDEENDPYITRNEKY